MASCRDELRGALNPARLEEPHRHAHVKEALVLGGDVARGLQSPARSGAESQSATWSDSMRRRASMRYSALKAISMPRAGGRTSSTTSRLFPRSLEAAETSSVVLWAVALRVTAPDSSAAKSSVRRSVSRNSSRGGRGQWGCPWG